MKMWLLTILLGTISTAHLFGSQQSYAIKRPTYKLSHNERIKKTRNLTFGIRRDLTEDSLIQTMQKFDQTRMILYKIPTYSQSRKIKNLIKNDDLTIDELTKSMQKVSVQTNMTLHNAIATSQSIETIANILEKSHAANELDKYEKTPLLYVVEKSAISPCATYNNRALHIEQVKTVIDLLLKHGAQINRIDRYGNTVLFKAMHTIDCPSEIIEHLIKCGANVNQKNNETNTPLLDMINSYLACGFGSKLEHIKALLKNGADVNAQNANGDTACHLLMNIKAGSFIKENTLAVLFDYNAQTEICNNNKETCLDIATSDESNFDIDTFITGYYSAQ